MKQGRFVACSMTKPPESVSEKVLRTLRIWGIVRDRPSEQGGRVAKARECRRDLFLTTDLLVGFPTETDKDYRATLGLAEELGFNDAFMFAYSERPHTIAARRYEDAVPRAEKLRRLNELIHKQRAWSAARNRSYLGQALPVIVEHADQHGAVARTAFNKPIQLGQVRTAVGSGSPSRWPRRPACRRTWPTSSRRSKSAWTASGRSTSPPASRARPSTPWPAICTAASRPRRQPLRRGAKK